MSDKQTGSFYTPEILIDYMIRFLRGRVNPKSILEPSAGDGRFIHKLYEEFGGNIHAVEFDKSKIDYLKSRYHDSAEIIHQDFLDFSLKGCNRYDLIIGNPPYISKKNMQIELRERSLDLLKIYDWPESLFQNIWVSFLVGCLNLLNNNGAIFLVLPFEFLQVQYAEQLRMFLEGKFNTIEIITFENKVFEGIEQDTCLVFLTNEIEEKPYVKYTTIKQPSNPDVVFSSVIMRNKPLKKWSNCILNDSETEKLKSIANQYPQVRTFGDISPGIVTAANSFFIIDSKTKEKINMKQDDIFIPIISKSNDLVNKFIFTKSDFDSLSLKQKKVWMLNLSNIKEETFSKELKKYLNEGIEKEIEKRYKCTKRTRWYDVPIIRTGTVAFFKRYNVLPRIIVNEAMTYTTDIAYNMRLNDSIDSKSLAFCFYNSLTLALCEYNGRFYGGGVGELVPNEFKDLYLPYKYIESQHIKTLDQMFQDARDMNEIIDYVDNIVLNLPNEDIVLLQSIRNRYLKRRLM